MHALLPHSLLLWSAWAKILHYSIIQLWGYVIMHGTSNFQFYTLCSYMLLFSVCFNLAQFITSIEWFSCDVHYSALQLRNKLCAHVRGHAVSGACFVPTNKSWESLLKASIEEALQYSHSLQSLRTMYEQDAHHLLLAADVYSCMVVTGTLKCFVWKLIHDHEGPSSFWGPESCILQVYDPMNSLQWRWHVHVSCTMCDHHKVSRATETTNNPNICAFWTSPMFLYIYCLAY